MTGLFLTLALLAPPPELVATSSVACKKLTGTPKVVGIGSSTMKGALGPMLRRLAKKRNLPLEMVIRAKSATGLARPDFFDWPAKVEKLVKEEQPQMWLVSMGTNDYQAVRKDKKWLRFPTEAWHKEYAARVRRMLELMSGPKRDRPVVYIGSTAFGRHASKRMGPTLNQVVKEQIERFDGPAIFYNAYAATSDHKHRALKSAKIPGTKRRFKVFGNDNVHLTRKGVQYLLAEPALQLLLECAGK